MGLSQRALARAVPMDVAQLSRLESGKGGVGQPLLERIAEILQVSLGVLYAETSVVEAAALQMRRIPVLTPVQLLQWNGPDSIEEDDEQEYLHAELRSVSRYSFALRVEDAANAPRLLAGDRLIFDAKKTPARGSMVVAQDNLGGTFIGQLLPLPGPIGSAEFDIVPLDAINHPIASTSHGRNLRLRGTLCEIRRNIN